MLEYDGRLVLGRNAKRHGGEFYIMAAEAFGPIASIRIADGERKKVAAWLRRAAKRIEPKKVR